MSDKKPKRREFLFTASYAVGAVGVGAELFEKACFRTGLFGNA